MIKIMMKVLLLMLTDELFVEEDIKNVSSRVDRKLPLFLVRVMETTIIKKSESIILHQSSSSW